MSEAILNPLTPISSTLDNETLIRIQYQAMKNQEIVAEFFRGINSYYPGTSYFQNQHPVAYGPSLSPETVNHLMATLPASQPASTTSGTTIFPPASLPTF